MGFFGAPLAAGVGGVEELTSSTDVGGVAASATPGRRHRPHGSQRRFWLTKSQLMRWVRNVSM